MAATIRERKWRLFLLALLVLASLEIVRQFVLPSDAPWQGRFAASAPLLVAALGAIGGLLHLAGRLEDRLQRRNQELETLHRTAIDIRCGVSLEDTLQRIADGARAQLNARYGAISVVDENRAIRAFLSSGIDHVTMEKIGAPPRGRGLIGVALDEGKALRLADLTRDPRATGFPSHHPEMHSLLAVPVTCSGPFKGNLYVADKTSLRPFDEDDEATLTRFAAKSALAIDNAYLCERLEAIVIAEERARIGREMHDGVAQILAYVNTKAQAVTEHLRSNNLEDAGIQLGQLSLAVRDAYADARESILALRTSSPPESSINTSLKEYFQRWLEQQSITGQIEVERDLPLGPLDELQLIRIIQEALTNARKHSHAGNVRVTIRPSNTAVLAEVEDDGCGFDPDHLARKGLPKFGLAIMRERAESTGGKLLVESSPGNGTRVRCEIPVRAIPR